MKEDIKIKSFFNLERVVQLLSKFIEVKMELYELKVKEQIVFIISSFTALAIIILLGLFMVFFLSLFLGYLLNDILNSNYLGFLIVGGGYLILSVLVIIYREKIITNRVIHAFFSKTLTPGKNDPQGD